LQTLPIVSEPSRILQARACVEAEDYTSAEEVYLRAARPELALAMYQETLKWQDAMRIAQRHLPHRVAEITQAYQTSQARNEKSGTRDDFFAAGRQFEQSKEWARAVDTYLSARTGAVKSPDELEEIWERAVQIARDHMPDRFVQVSVDVARRLAAIQRFELAGELLFEANRREEAVNVCLEGKAFNKARELAKGSRELTQLIERAYQGHLKEQGQADELIGINTTAALDVLRKKGEWDKLWATAVKVRQVITHPKRFIVTSANTGARECCNHGTVRSASRTG
jgi:intraflagellar transport protein 172